MLNKQRGEGGEAGLWVEVHISQLQTRPPVPLYWLRSYSNRDVLIMLYSACDVLSMLVFKLNYVSVRGPSRDSVWHDRKSMNPQCRHCLTNQMPENHDSLEHYIEVNQAWWVTWDDVNISCLPEMLGNCLTNQGTGNNWDLAECAQKLIRLGSLK